jgi:hypothetical protein
MTVLGHHTVAELRDWLSALDYQAGQIANAHGAFAPTWKVRDAAALSHWEEDWQAFVARYGAARAKARAAIARAQFEIGVPDSLIPVEDEWNGVQHALTKTPGTTSKGDFQDLYNRLAAAQAKPIDMSATPQPTATDADLNVFKAADATIRAGEAAGRELAPSKGTGAMVVIGAGLALALLLALRSVFK